MKRDAAFPRPVHIGRYRYWHLDAIEAYERSVAAKRCSSVTYPSAALRY
jgi:predicted DNA-binding transcriptional regulator AlpA